MLGWALVFFIVAIIAAIAIPNLLESRKQANEMNAIGATRTYAGAQSIYKKANYAAGNDLKPKQYCPTLPGLSAHKTADGRAIGLIPPPLAAAISPERGYQGYYFLELKGIEYQDEFGLYAAPCQYGKTGSNTFFIGTDGTTYMKDMGGEVPDPAQRPNLDDGTWTTP